MRRIAILAAGALCVVGLLSAHDEGYQIKKMATVHDIMADIVKPNMDKLAEMRKAGGPADMDGWKAANRAASIVAEGNQLMLVSTRIKDAEWEKGAKMVIEAAEKTMLSAMRQDKEGWAEGVGAMGAGCKTCHSVHKPKK